MKWNEFKAVSHLRNSGAEVTEKHIFISAKGITGLSACSAFDYLVNNRKYSATIAIRRT